jgi:type II secretion system (T2SS) protein M
MRTLFLGAGCVATMLGMSKALPVLIASRRNTSAKMRQTRTQLAQDRQIVAGRGEVLKSLDRTTTAFLGISPAFLKGATASQAAATLASIVADAADANGVHLTSLQPQNDSVARSLIVPVSVRVSGTGDIRGLSGMLRDLESGVPLIDVRQLTIAQPDPTAPADRMESLHAELMIRGLYRRVPGGSDDRDQQ